MSIPDGHDAIIRRARQELSSTNFVLPNGPGASLPRYVVQEAGGRERTLGLDGATEAFPEVLFLAETEAGVYSGGTSNLVRALVQVFRPGTRFEGCTVLVPPDVRPPLPVADGVYSVPVYVSARIVF